MNEKRDVTRDDMANVLHGLSCVQALFDKIRCYTPGQDLALAYMREHLKQARHFGLQFNRQREQNDR